MPTEMDTVRKFAAAVRNKRRDIYQRGDCDCSLLNNGGIK